MIKIILGGVRGIHIKNKEIKKELLIKTPKICSSAYA